MAKSGQATLRGRFSKGDIVTLTRVAGAHTLRPEGGEDVQTKTVGESDGVSEVKFSGLDIGGRYIAHGIHDGFPLQVRITARSADEDTDAFAQPPVGPDRVRLSDGSWADEAPTKESAPELATTFAGQRQIPKGMVQRSDTPRGSGHPVDPDAEEPVRRQESVPDGVVQMSDTRPRELKDGTKVGGGGEATEIVLGPQRQEDVPKGVIQRSSTPAGVAQPLPKGDMAKAQLDRDSSAGRESRGEANRVGAEPLDAKGVKSGAPTGASKKQSEERHAEILKSDRAPATGTLVSEPEMADGTAGQGLDRSGLDAQGQPVDPGVAAAAGVEPAEKPSEPVSKSSAAKAKRSEAAKKAARTRKRNQSK